MKAIFCFYDKCHGIKDKLTFSKDIKHCNLILCENDDYMMVFLNKNGISVDRIKIKQNIETFIKKIRVSNLGISAIIVVDVHTRHKPRWSPIIVNTCNEISRMISGVDIGLTINCAHLFYKLKKHNFKKNYEIVDFWRKKDGR